MKTPVAKFIDGVMMIEKVDLNAEANAFIEKEQEKHEIENGVIYNCTPFCFVSKINGTVVGAITGETFILKHILMNWS